VAQAATRTRADQDAYVRGEITLEELFGRIKARYAG